MILIIEPSLLILSQQQLQTLDIGLGLLSTLLLVLLIYQTTTFFYFSKQPPPIVPPKVLPTRPALEILFKPDEVFKEEEEEEEDGGGDVIDYYCEGSSSYNHNRTTTSSSNINHPAAAAVATHNNNNNNNNNSDEALSTSSVSSDNNNNNRSSSKKKPPPMTRLEEYLPESFAPLMSSRQIDVQWTESTFDLIHALDFKASAQIREGNHKIPLNKDSSRPQLTLHVPKGQTKVSVNASVGSQGFTKEKDFDPMIPTNERTKTLIKGAGLILEPPLSLGNVVPTLVHIPNLFEDHGVSSTRRRIQGFQWILQWIAYIVAFLEKCLWLLEKHCQIYLSKATATPSFKNREGNFNKTQWRVRLSFSGHVMLFNWVPIPFVNITLPTFIIPAPHAILERFLTLQPLASARVKHENIEEDNILIAIIESLESWNLNAKTIVTPPALGVDVTLPGGVAVAVEAMLGRDISPSAAKHEFNELISSRMHPSSSFSSLDDYDYSAPAKDVASNASPAERRSVRRSLKLKSMKGGQKSFKSKGSRGKNAPAPKPFDANTANPWTFEVSVSGKIENETISINVKKCSALSEPNVSLGYSPSERSYVSMTGNWQIGRPDPSTIDEIESNSMKSGSLNRNLSSASNTLKLIGTELPSVARLLVFYDEYRSTISLSDKRDRMLQYDYKFQIGDHANIDALSVSVGASHPLLQGGTIITTVLESIYGFGEMSARSNSTFDLVQQHRKRDILTHLPAMDFTVGIQNIFIPEGSNCFSDDGLTLYVPEMKGGRMTLRIIGGKADDKASESSRGALAEVTEGVKVTADFGISSFQMNSESHVSEFPELDILDGVKLLTLVSGSVSGRIQAHLRPQKRVKKTTYDISHHSRSRAVKPSEPYEIVFSGTSASIKLKETNITLGHRRIIFPSESNFSLYVKRSVLDMSLDGMTLCECSWDFQGSSPILQVTDLGHSPATVEHENKDQISLLIAPLRQGRLNLNVSAVGGISFSPTDASDTSHAGLYDWKFFNALVAPDDESLSRLYDVVHDKQTMNKMVQIVSLVSSSLGRLLEYVLTQVWHAKDIFDQEGISGPGHAIPGHSMARLVSLFLSGDLSQVEVVLPIIRRVTSGDGLDVVKTKEIIREHFKKYDEWAPEIDRVVRWFAVCFGPMYAPQPYVEKSVPPLCELSIYSNSFSHIPSAKTIYETINEKIHIPLDIAFSRSVSLIAPYMSFRQVEYIVNSRSKWDWQPDDLRRLQYVYSIKQKVLDISESYGGLSFLPQSFFVSIFLGEATRSSLRARKQPTSTLAALRNRRKRIVSSTDYKDYNHTDNGLLMSPASRRASTNVLDLGSARDHLNSEDYDTYISETVEPYELGNSLLGPQDVAILLQAGLASANKGSTVVQLNQRMLLDLISSQPYNFAIAVLAEIGTPGGYGSPRSLASALMSFLELDQSSFTHFHRIDMPALLESWLPGYRMPRRQDYLAGGRWARQSYYDALFVIAKNILADAEPYMALKGHIQRVRHNLEIDPVSVAKELFVEEKKNASENEFFFPIEDSEDIVTSTLIGKIEDTKEKIAMADELGEKALSSLLRNLKASAPNESTVCNTAVNAYNDAFRACAEVLEADVLAFQAPWFKSFYRRNYDALMVKSVYDNVIDNVDNVRVWLDALKDGAERLNEKKNGFQDGINDFFSSLTSPFKGEETSDENDLLFLFNMDGKEIEDSLLRGRGSMFFTKAESRGQQELIEKIIEVLFYNEDERVSLKKDPLVRLLISNEPGNYNFTVISAMGIITEGKKGSELEEAFCRIKEKRGVEVIRADTGTARSFEYNAGKIEDAIEMAVEMNKPYGLLGYSQGCANILMAESSLLSGSPSQQKLLNTPGANLVCRQLLFSAANGSFHGAASDSKAQKLIVMGEEAFKYQQGVFSRACISHTLDTLNGAMDSAGFHKFMGGAQSMLPDGVRAFWREAQHLPLPTCVLRGVLEPHTTPESLEMITNLLTKQSGSALHDSQVHVFDAVGHPVYTKNRNAHILEHCDMGGAIQRTHHWSPLDKEVEFIRTKRDLIKASFDCAKDRHIFPWVDVNARFGIIKYKRNNRSNGVSDSKNN